MWHSVESTLRKGESESRQIKKWNILFRGSLCTTTQKYGTAILYRSLYASRGHKRLHFVYSILYGEARSQSGAEKCVAPLALRLIVVRYFSHIYSFRVVRRREKKTTSTTIPGVLHEHLVGATKTNKCVGIRTYEYKMIYRTHSAIAFIPVLLINFRSRYVIVVCVLKWRPSSIHSAYISHFSMRLILRFSCSFSLVPPVESVLIKCHCENCKEFNFHYQFFVLSRRQLHRVFALRHVPSVKRVPRLVSVHVHFIRRHWSGAQSSNSEWNSLSTSCDIAMVLLLMNYSLWSISLALHTLFLNLASVYRASDQSNV